MINFDDVTKENIKQLNPSGPQIPDHSYRMLIIVCSGSGKTFIIQSNKFAIRY